MEDIEREHRQEDWCAVEHIEVDLGRDNLPCPSICKFDGSINGADEHPNSHNPHAKEHQAEFGWEGGKALL